MEPRILPPSANERVAPAPFPYRHYLSLQMRFSDFDMFGHLNNNAIMSFFDLGKVAYYRAVLGDGIDPTQAGVVIVNISCDFLAPTYPTDSMEVYTVCEHVGHRSMRLEQRLVNAATLEPHAICRTVLAGFDPAKGCGADLRADWIEALSRFEGRDVLA